MRQRMPEEVVPGPGRIHCSGVKNWRPSCRETPSPGERPARIGAIFPRRQLESPAAGHPGPRPHLEHRRTRPYPKVVCHLSTGTWFDLASTRRRLWGRPAAAVSCCLLLFPPPYPIRFARRCKGLLPWRPPPNPGCAMCVSATSSAETRSPPFGGWRKEMEEEKKRCAYLYSYLYVSGTVGVGGRHAKHPHRPASPPSTLPFGPKARSACRRRRRRVKG